MPRVIGSGEKERVMLNGMKAGEEDPPKEVPWLNFSGVPAGECCVILSRWHFERYAILSLFCVTLCRCCIVL
jgi:hypothetical protein